MMHEWLVKLLREELCDTEHCALMVSQRALDRAFALQKSGSLEKYYNSACAELGLTWRQGISHVYFVKKSPATHIHVYES